MMPFDAGSKGSEVARCVFWVACLVALALSGCGRDEVVVGNLGDACFETDDCAFGLECERGRCVPSDGDPNPDPNPGPNPDPNPGPNPDPNPEPNPGVDPNPEPGCRVGTLACLDDFTIGRCDGDGFVPFAACGDSVCRNGECISDAECFDGERRCSGRSFVEACENGRWFLAQECPQNSPCEDGFCQDDGEELPDIIADFFDFGPRTVEAGGALSFELGVGNLGEAATPRFDCTIFITQNEIDPRRNARLGQASFSRLGVGDFEGLGFRGTLPRNTQPGNYGVYAFCDAGNRVRETNENNNIFLADGTLRVVREDEDPRPDLFIEFIAPEADVLQEGEDLPVFGVACNLGREDAQNVEIQIDATFAFDPEETLYTLGTIEIDFLGAGECFDFFEEVGPVRCVDEDFIEYGLSATIDPDNRVIEENENNNTFFEGFIFFVDGCEDECGDRFDPEDQTNPPIIPPNDYNLELCPGDRDIFALTAGPGAQVNFGLDTDPNNTILVLVFQETDGERIRLTSAQTNRGVLESSITVPENAERLILLIEPRQIRSPEYTLFYDFDDDPGELPDLRVASPTLRNPPFEPGGAITVQVNSLNEGPGFADSHVMDVFIVQGFRDDINRRVLLGRLESGPLNPGQRQPFNQAFMLPGNLNAGPHVMVFVDDARNQVREVSEQNNTLTTPFVIENPQQECVDDMFEPNNDLNNPSELELPNGEEIVIEGLVVCQGNGGGDFFQICPPEGSEITFTARFDDDRGDIDMRLFNSANRSVDTGTGVQDIEDVTVSNTDGGCYTAEIYLFGSQDNTNSYTLTVDVELPDNPNVCTEAFEPNNSFQQAQPLFEAAEASVLDFCPAGDEDYFSAVFAEGNVITLRATPLGEQPPGNIVLALYGPNANFITQRFERAPELVHTVTESGSYFIRLTTASTAELFQYTLDVETE